MENKHIIEFNRDQVKHIQLVQTYALNFTHELMQEAVEHDTTKWFKEEYDTFVNSRNSLNQSKDGKDMNYQKTLLSDAVQHHYKHNKHHPEYWKDEPNSMPVIEVIIMFFDWASRTVAKGGQLDNFWSYNIQKLKECQQDHAIAIVERLKLDYGADIDANAISHGVFMLENA